MFRILKLAVYALIGYALYEFYLGLGEVRAKQPQSQAPSTPGESPRPNRQGGRRVAVRDNSGVERTQSVGRGVVSR